MTRRSAFFYVVSTVVLAVSLLVTAVEAAGDRPDGVVRRGSQICRQHRRRRFIHLRQRAVAQQRRREALEQVAAVGRADDAPAPQADALDHAEEIAAADARIGCLVMGTSDLAKDLHARHTPDRAAFATSIGTANVERAKTNRPRIQPLIQSIPPRPRPVIEILRTVAEQRSSAPGSRRGWSRHNASGIARQAMDGGARAHAVSRPTD